MSSPLALVPRWVTILTALAAVAIIGIAIIAQGDQPVDWPLVAVMFVLVNIGSRVVIETERVTVDGAMPSYILSAILLGPGPAVALAATSVLLLPGTIEYLRDRSAHPVFAPVINVASCALTFLLCSLAARYLPEETWALVLCTVMLYLAAEIFNYCLIILPSVVMGDRRAIDDVRAVSGQLICVAIGDAVIAATVVAVYQDVGMAALILGGLLVASSMLLQRQVFGAVDLAEQARRSTEELAGRQLGVLHTMMSAFERRDPALAAHSRAVSALGRNVAERANLGTSERQMIEVVGLLHDIGKFALPDQLRSGSGRDERALDHPVLGAQVIAPLAGYGPVAEAIASQAHAFAPPGGGAPPPLAARVIAVADAYDTLISGSSQARAMDPHTALARLRSRAGSQFDPHVVETFCQMILDDGAPTDDADPSRMLESWSALTDTPEVQRVAHDLVAAS